MHVQMYMYMYVSVLSTFQVSMYKLHAGNQTLSFFLKKQQNKKTRLAKDTDTANYNNNA